MGQDPLFDMLTGNGVLSLVEAPLTLVSGLRNYAAAMSVIAVEQGSLDDLCLRILSAREVQLLPGSRYPHRQHDILAGRMAAKRALGMIVPIADPQDVSILPGVLAQPVVSGTAAEKLGVTISHAGCVALSIAFPMECPVGVDVEELDFRQLDALSMHAEEGEVDCISAVLGCDALTALTAIWSAKEALSKLLGCGLAANRGTLKIGRVEFLDPHLTVGFAGFSGYHVLVTVGARRCGAVAIPPGVRWVASGNDPMALRAKWLDVVL